MKSSVNKTIGFKNAVNDIHPAVVLRLPYTTGNGTLKVGRIVAKVADSIVPYANGDASAGTPVGVLTREVNTAASGSDDDGFCNVLVHGTVNKADLLVADGTDVVQGDIDALAGIGIYSI